jgi:hypothetical protein
MPTIEGTLKEKAWAIDRAKGWDLAFILDPWRKVDASAWSEAPLYVYVALGTKAKAEKMARLYKGRSSVRLFVNSVRSQGDYIARAAGKLPVTKIPLLAATKKKKARDSFRDDVLGTFRLEREFEWVSTRMKIGGASSCEVAIGLVDVDDEEGIAQAIVKSRAVVAHCKATLDKIRDAVTKKLLPLYNKTWRDEDSRELTPQAFRAKISKPIELHISTVDEVATLRLHAGGLFTDHAIEVKLTLRGRIMQITLA